MFHKVAALIFVAALIAIPSAAFADHHEEQDGCDHGATSQPCRPDPSDNGKDCDVHGNHGGINEDHCQTDETTTTTSISTTTSTTVSLDTTSTTTGTAPSTTMPAPATFSTPEQPGQKTAVAPLTTAIALPVSTTELPHTGWDAGLLFVIGTALVLAGLSTWFAGKAMG